MTWKLIGSVFVIISCAGFGFITASEHYREVKSLKNLVDCLNYMEWELKYRMTHLPDLCNDITNQFGGIIKSIFKDLAESFDMQSEPDAQHCMERILSNRKDVPSYTKTALYYLGRSLGKFDLEGQIKGIHSVRVECVRNLEHLQNNQAVRIRSYKTLGLCAGAAIAILFF